MRYAYPGSKDPLIVLKSQYGNFINSEFVPPVEGRYFTNTPPINGWVMGIPVKRM